MIVPIQISKDLKNAENNLKFTFKKWATEITGFLCGR